MERRDFLLAGVAAGALKTVKPMLERIPLIQTVESFRPNEAPALPMFSFKVDKEILVESISILGKCGGYPTGVTFSIGPIFTAMLFRRGDRLTLTNTPGEWI